MVTCLTILSLACGDPAAETSRQRVGVAMDTPVADSPREPSSRSAGNHAPQIAGVSFEPEVPCVGDTLKAIVDVSDDDDDLYWLSYSWTVAGEVVGQDEDQISIRDTRRGDIIELAVLATDGKQASEPFLAELRVGNSPPRISEVVVHPGGDISRGISIELRTRATDLDGDPIEHRYEWTVDGRPHPEVGPELKTDRIRRGSIVRGSVFVSDEIEEGEPFHVPEITIANAPPTILSVPGGSSDEGVFEYRVEVVDLDGDRNFRFSLEEAPKGMEIDAVEGLIRWLPADGQEGIHQPIVVADDSHGGLTRQEIEVRVQEPTAGNPPARGEW